MAGFAVLTVDWHSNSRSYSDNFINFVLSAVDLGRLRKFSPDEAADALQSAYGISLPLRVVQQIVRRAHKSKLLDKDALGAYSVSQKGLDSINGLVSDKRDLAREQRHLEAALVDFAAEFADISLTTVDAGVALIDYVETYYGTLMSASLGSGSIGSLPPAEPTQMQRVVAAFIDRISTSDPDRFSYVLRIAQGSMLVAALFTPTPIQQERSFHDTTLFLDTKLLIRLLGYEGERAQSSVSEYVNLAVAQGARVGYFDFTLAEMKSVFAWTQMQAKKGQLWSSRPGTVGAHYFAVDASPGQIDLDIASLESRLSKLGVANVSSPVFDPRFVIDETALEDRLRKSSPTYKHSALQHDVKALAAIVRYRRGRARDNLEDCRAVFITLNARLIRAAKSVADFIDEPWYVAMYEADVATLLWIKSPPAAPDLPREVLLATCLGLLNPSQSMWPNYVKELERLHESGELSDGELLLVRQKYEVSHLSFLVHSDSRGDEYEDDVVRSVRQVIDETVEDIRRPVREEMDNAAAQIGAKAAEAELALATLVSRSVASVKARSKAQASVLRFGITGILVAAVLLTLLPTIPVVFSDAIDSFGKVVLALAAIFGSLTAPGKAIAGAVEGNLVARRLRSLGLDAHIPSAPIK